MIYIYMYTTLVYYIKFSNKLKFSIFLYSLSLCVCMCLLFVCMCILSFVFFFCCFLVFFVVVVLEDARTHHVLSIAIDSRALTHFVNVA